MASARRRLALSLVRVSKATQASLALPSFRSASLRRASLVFAWIISTHTRVFVTTVSPVTTVLWISMSAAPIHALTDSALML